MEPVLLESNVWRYFRASLFPVVVAMALGAFIATVPFGGSWTIAGMMAAGGLFGTFLGGLIGWRRVRVYVADGVVDAPQNFARTRLRIAMGDIDRERSSQRGRWRRFAGERCLWTRDGQRVVLNDRWYPAGALADLWRRLGCRA